jgi:O-antigen ligase
MRRKVKLAANNAKVSMYSNSLNTIITFMSVIAVFFFSYIPFLYIFSIIGIEKNIIFILLISAILILALFSFTGQMLRGKIQFYKRNITALSLYLLFAIYALVSFFLIGEKLNDLFTIRTLVLINPIFVLLALLCLQNKNNVINLLYLLSFSYFIILIWSLIQGNISLSSNNEQNIFMNIDNGFYQNINMYLGLFAICNLGLLSSNNKFISVISKILILLSVIGMFIIGGRGSVVALVAIFLIYYINILKSFTFTLSFILKSIILIIIVVALMAFYFAEITQILNASITWQRFMMLTKEGDESLRIYLFSHALELFFSNIKTMIFGAGINSFSVYIGVNDLRMFPHNILLELLAEYGTVGTILFAIPAGYIISIRNKILGSTFGDCINEQIIFLIFIYILINDLFNGALRTSWMFIFFMFLLIPSRKDIELFNKTKFRAYL